MSNSTDADAAPLVLGGEIRRILDELGEDPGRDGLRKTPERVEKALRCAG